ncbi:MAG: coproporphyrinogen-III oxidase family protein [Chloroflexota bacterium]
MTPPVASDSVTVRASAQAAPIPGEAVPVAGGAGPPIGLYLHVPFCGSLCPYCDFVVVAGAKAVGPRNRVDAFVAALRREIDLRADLLEVRWGVPGTTVRPALATLYLGGGTPSLLPPDEVAGLLELVRARFGLATDAEITIEANPGPDERGDARRLAAAGINRISFGAQAMDAISLRSVGRRHRPADVAAAVLGAREAGVPSISLDLLYDLPGSTLGTWVNGLEAALSLEPDHLSLYALSLDDPDAEGLTGADGDHLPVSRGARTWRARARGFQDEDRAADMYEHAVTRLASAGFDGYEISNWARPGHRSRHNLAYWQRLPYEAVGPGAHAFDGTTRRWNAAPLDRYIAALTPPDGGEPHLPPGSWETIGPSAAAAERVILGLRTSDGLPAAAADQEPLASSFEWALAAGFLVATPDARITLTTRGRLLANELFSRLV